MTDQNENVQDYVKLQDGSLISIPRRMADAWYQSQRDLDNARQDNAALQKRVDELEQRLVSGGALAPR